MRTDSAATSLEWGYRGFCFSDARLGILGLEAILSSSQRSLHFNSSGHQYILSSPSDLSGLVVELPVREILTPLGYARAGCTGTPAAWKKIVKLVLKESL